MITYWESRFKEEGMMWGIEPSNSAIRALLFFRTNGIQKILIPGFGYGRNAKLFIEQGFDITGIEISKSAIELARKLGMQCVIHQGSVLEMPYDDQRFEGIFCYALLHLFNRKDRKKILDLIYKQLKPEGYMIFTVVSTVSAMYGTGKQLSRDRFLVNQKLKVFFYNSESVQKEFEHYGLLGIIDLEEPIKHLEGVEPLKCKYIVCQKKG